MLGNDIVDLSLAKVQSNWQRRGYLAKIFTADEQILIHSSKKPDAIVWLLWSMKEAAYKIYNRQTGIRSFAPTDLRCNLKQFTVSIGSYLYYTKSSINSDYIHTISSANAQQLKQVEVSIHQFPNHPINYKNSNPGCVSHHGRYLALIY